MTESEIINNIFSFYETCFISFEKINEYEKCYFFIEKRYKPITLLMDCVYRKGRAEEYDIPKNAEVLDELTLRENKIYDYIIDEYKLKYLKEYKIHFIKKEKADNLYFKDIITQENFIEKKNEYIFSRGITNLDLYSLNFNLNVLQIRYK